VNLPTDTPAPTATPAPGTGIPGTPSNPISNGSILNAQVVAGGTIIGNAINIEPKKSVTVNFSTADGATVSNVLVVDGKGNVVNTIPVTVDANGNYSVIVPATNANGSSLAAGTYQIRIIANDGSIVNISFTVPRMMFIVTAAKTPVFSASTQKSPVLFNLSKGSYGLVVEQGSSLAKVSFHDAKTNKDYFAWLKLSDIVITVLDKSKVASGAY